MEYTEMLKEYLGTRRNLNKKVYKFMSTAFRAVESKRITLDSVVEITGGKYNE